MISLLPNGARISLLCMLLVLAGCGGRSGEIKITPPSPHPRGSCPMLEDPEFQEQVASLVKIFPSSNHATTIALAALAFSGDIPFECIETVERQGYQSERGGMK